ncbi:helix-turn-helix domain-containing protein [Lysinibacillus sp. OTC-L20]|uniref:helix-turn-helix domain-containing protein n=1 Tax=Lysinibacillus sp. OTC-L20 TaxID=3342791 RepID=UPI0035BA8BEE
MTNEITQKGNFLKIFADDTYSQLTDAKLTIDNSKGIATLSGKKDGHFYSVTIEQSELGQSKTETIYKELGNKYEYKEEVQRLRKQGLKQKDIALRLGISQSSVSNLLKD